jgi:hypothetical protein
MNKVLEITQISRHEKVGAKKDSPSEEKYGISVTAQGTEENGNHSYGTFFFSYSDREKFWIGKQITLSID